jgi:oxygen-dependent protoporphyrinogen oxidase
MIADSVVLAGGASTTAGIVQTIDEPLAETLREMPTAGLVVVCLGFVEEQLPMPLDGFGYLVPRCEGLRTLGCLWDSSVYPGRAPAGRVLLRVMIGGGTDRGALELDDAALLDVVRADLRTVMGLEAAPEFARIIRHPIGIPQYTVGHLVRLARAEARLVAHPGLVLAGNGYRGVSINACLADAASVVERALPAGARRRIAA